LVVVGIDWFGLLKISMVPRLAAASVNLGDEANLALIAGDVHAGA